MSLRLRHVLSLMLKATAKPRELAVRNDGAAAVEFAIIATPFLALMFAILQTGLIYFAEQSLETAAADTSRLILTGQAQSQGFDQGAFKTAVCARLSSLLSCSGIMIDVRTSSDFSSANTSLPVDQNGNLQKTFLYQPGAAGDIVVVRLMYQWPMYISLSGLSKSFADLANGQDILMATVVFRNEPYQ